MSCLNSENVFSVSRINIYHYINTIVEKRQNLELYEARKKFSTKSSLKVKEKTETKFEVKNCLY